MENILSFYDRRYSAESARGVCVDEKPVAFQGDRRTPVSCKPGSVLKREHGYRKALINSGHKMLTQKLIRASLALSSYFITSLPLQARILLFGHHQLAWYQYLPGFQQLSKHPVFP